MDKTLVVLVHGFGSSPSTWDTLIGLFQQDPALSKFSFDQTFAYPTPWFNFNPFGRIPRLSELGGALAAHLDLPEFKTYKRVVLVGHSQGGLVIQSYLASKLIAREGQDLRRICEVVMIATPNQGSTFANSIRQKVSRISLNPQERTLCVLNPEINDLRRVITSSVVDAAEQSATESPIPIMCFWGLNDAIVPEASAKGEFKECKPLRGDHFAVLKPAGLKDDNYRLLAQAILEPPGHKSIFELDRYEMHLTVEPRVPPVSILCEHGTTKRDVVTDNVAHLTRTATFSAQNRCKKRFSMGYGTRGEGFVKGFGNVTNEAESTHIGTWEDHGAKHVFEFTPQAANTYTFDADIYRGYDKGSRDIHFHLRPDRHYRTVQVRLDLSPYVKADWTITEEPVIYFHAHDPGSCGEVCKRRRRDDAVNSHSTAKLGIYTWEFAEVRDGVLDVVWDVKAPAPKAETAGHAGS